MWMEAIDKSGESHEQHVRARGGTKNNVPRRLQSVLNHALRIYRYKEI